MHTAAPRKDNLLGICHAIGEDFGFNPFWLRVVLAAGIIWQPVIVLSIYAMLGLAVLASRLLTRRRGVSAPQVSATVSTFPQRVEPEPMRQAA